MATVHLVDGEKGGTGKSWFAFTLTQYLREHHPLFYLVATDRSNPTTTNRYRDKEHYQEFYDDTIRYAIFSESEKKIDSPDDIFEWAMERTTLVDLPSQVHRSVVAWIDGKDVIKMGKQHGVKLVRWFVCDGEDDSINLFVKSAEYYQKKVTNVLVKNWGRCDEWEYFDEHEQLQETIAKYKVKVIDFPKLSDGKRIKINARRWTFDEAMESGEFKTLGKQDIHQYLKTAYRAFESTKLFKREEMQSE
jgi:hypothetical protein